MLGKIAYQRAFPMFGELDASGKMVMNVLLDHGDDWLV